MCVLNIKLFNTQNNFNNTLNRLSFENSPITEKQDQQYFADRNNIEVWWEELKSLIINFDLAWKHYEENVGAKSSYGVDDFRYNTLKIQKTLPTEGYHI